MSDSVLGNNFLRAFLERARSAATTEDRLAADPIGIVRQYDNPQDREVVALITASLAYGRASLVRDAASRALESLGAAPAIALRDRPFELHAEALEGFVYRMTRAQDLADLYCGLGDALRNHGSLQAAYAAGSGTHLERASHFVQRIRGARARPELARGLRYLLVDPGDGSAAKRLHMFFRWVVRRDDGVDLGLWDQPSAGELRMPLDTHTSRIARYLGFTDRKATDARTVEEVTSALRAIEPEDPTRYDFALAHLGISGSCIHRRSPLHCPACPVDSVCKLQ